MSEQNGEVAVNGDTEHSGQNGVGTLEYEHIVDWIKKRIKLPKFNPEMWGEDHDEAAIEFISNPACSRA